MEFVYAIVIGYLLGSVNPAYLFGRMKGFDIRTVGSKNAGASNAKITLGWGYFAVTVVYDVLKCVISMAIVKYLLHGSDLAATMAGSAAIVGHCFPFYLGFRGGKGFASMIGMTIAMNLPVAVGLIVFGVVGALICNYICFATFTVSFGFAVYMLVFSNAPVELSLVVACTSALVLFQHRSNVVKFLRKEEIGINGKPIGIKVLKDPE